MFWGQVETHPFYNLYHTVRSRFHRDIAYTVHQFRKQHFLPCIFYGSRQMNDIVFSFRLGGSFWFPELQAMKQRSDMLYTNIIFMVLMILALLNKLLLIKK